MFIVIFLIFSHLTSHFFFNFRLYFITEGLIKQSRDLSTNYTTKQTKKHPMLRMP